LFADCVSSSHTDNKRGNCLVWSSVGCDDITQVHAHLHLRVSCSLRFWTRFKTSFAAAVTWTNTSINYPSNVSTGVDHATPHRLRDPSARSRTAVRIDVSRSTNDEFANRNGLSGPSGLKHHMDVFYSPSPTHMTMRAERGGGARADRLRCDAKCPLYLLGSSSTAPRWGAFRPFTLAHSPL
ncbi:hypothetical protein CI238_11439, partial [Colletotrichum incanum]